VAAVGAKKLDLLMPQLLVMTIKFAIALRAGHPEDFRHGSFLPRERKSEIRISKSETNSKSNKSQTGKIQNAESESNVF
jgi:hypothetical protein